MMDISKFTLVPCKASTQENDQFLIRALTHQESGDMIKVLNGLIDFERGLFSQSALDRGLLLACRLGNIPAVRGLLKHGANPEARDERGNTALLNCAELSQSNMARFLLQNGADVNVTNGNGETPLIVTSYQPELSDLTQFLLKQPRVDIRHKNNFGYTALMYATNATNIPVMKLLIDAEEDDVNMEPNRNSDVTRTTLDQLAMEKGLLAILKLFQHEARTGISSLHQAVLNKDIESVKILVLHDFPNHEFNVCKVLDEFIKTFKGHPKEVEYTIVRVLSERSSCIQEEKTTKEHTIEGATETGDSRLIRILCDSRFVGSNKSLAIAAAKGRCDILCMLIDSGADVDKRDDNGRVEYLSSPLDVAIDNVQFNCANILLERGATFHLNCAVKKVVDNGNTLILEWICQRFPSSLREEFQRAEFLHMAVAKCDRGSVNILLDHGAKIDLVIDNMTPLMHAVDTEMIDLLIAMGADVNFKTASFYKKTALTHYFSTSYHNQLSVKWASQIREKTKSKFLVKKLEDIVSKILKHGANVNEVDLYDQPLLAVATRTEFPLGLMKLLLDAGADVDAGSIQGNSALQAAVGMGSIELVEFLISRGADLNQTNIEGQSLIFMSDDCEVIKYLISNGAVVNRTDNSGQSPIFMFGDCEVIKCLISNGAVVNRTDNSGQSPIFMFDDCEAIELLLKNGADVNVLDKNGNTALIHAFKHFFSGELLDTLIKAGCNIEHKNNSGKSALDMAIKYRDYDATKCLILAGADVNPCINSAIGRTSMNRHLRKMWDQPDSTRTFFHLLLDHKANFSNSVRPCVLHFLIASGCLSLVPKMICSGLGPADAVIQKSGKGWYKFEAGLSPLGTALLVNNVKLAKYFLEMRFLTKSDIFLLFKNDRLSNHLRENHQLECLKFIQTTKKKPFSLETLSFVAVSSAIGSGPGRHDRIVRAGLPIDLQTQMLYEDATSTYTFQDDGNKQSLSLVRAFYRNITGEDYEFCDSDVSDSDDFIFYIDDDDLSDSDC